MSYDHRVEINAEDKKIRIYRVHLKKGTDVFVTEININDIESNNSREKILVIARMIGEIILVDSEIARKILDI